LLDDLDKKFNLGQTKLNHNPIINPVPNFKYNKYLYRDSPNQMHHINTNNTNNNNVNLSNSLRMTGNNIIS